MTIQTEIFFKGTIMNKRKKDSVEEVGETGIKAITRLTLALSDTNFLCPEDWIIMLGHIFALFIENMNLCGRKVRIKKKVIFDEMMRSDFDVDRKIEENLSGLSRKEKIALIAFLIGISHPLSYMQVEKYASVKLPVNF
jgi:hypothetical protein